VSDQFDILQYKYRSPFLTTVLSHLADGNILDIGAYIGYYTQKFASWTSGRVYAFEPHKESYNELVNNTRQFKNVTTYNVAVGDVCSKQGILYVNPKKLVDNRLHPSGDVAREEEMVEVITIDSWMERNKCKYCNSYISIDMIKLDTQGSEGLIVLGMLRTLRNHSPILIIEFSPRHLDQTAVPAGQLLELLAKNNYKYIWNIDENTREIVRTTPKKLVTYYRQAGCHTDILCLKEPYYGDYLARCLR